MNILTHKQSLWRLLQDPQVRTGLYTWFLIAGICVVLANAFAAG